MVGSLAFPQVSVASDSPAFDQRWLDMLLTFAGAPLSVTLVHTAEIFTVAFRPLLELLPSTDDPSRETALINIRKEATAILQETEAAERTRRRVRHRALPDAQGLAWIYREIRDRVAGRVSNGL